MPPVERELLLNFIRSTQPMSDHVCATIAERFSPLALQRDAHLLLSGEIADRYLFVARGALRAYTHNPIGDEVTTGFFLEGRVALEVDSFFNRTPSRECIVALTDVEGFTLTFEELNGLFHAHPEFREFGRRVLVRGFTRLKQRMVDMAHLTAEQRYAKLLREEAPVLQVAPLKHIASYLGVTDTSLSRIRKELVKG